MAIIADPVQIATFGYLHAGPPSAHITLDLRLHFRDPHVNPAMRHMTAHDAEVREAVLNTAGIRPLIEATAAAVSATVTHRDLSKDVVSR